MKNIFLDMWLTEGSVVSVLEEDHEKGKKYSLSKYKKSDINDITIQRYKKYNHFLSHIIGGTGYQGAMYLDGTAVVGVVNVNIETKCIQALEVGGVYQNHGIATQLLNYAVKTIGATNLTVNRKNEVAISFYKDHDFVIDHSNENIHYMKLKGVK